MGKGLGTSIGPIMAGVRTDLLELMRQFCSKESLRFQKFATAFHHMQMSAIYCGRQNAAELLEFEEKLLQMAAAYAMSQPHHQIRKTATFTDDNSSAEKESSILLVDSMEERSLQERVCGVYMMYTLYYLQPTDFATFIRVTPEQMADLERLMDERLRPEAHSDTLYCLCRLLEDEAFRIVAYEDEYDPLHFKEYENAGDAENSIAPSGVDLHVNELQQLLDDVVTMQADTIHRRYNKLKDILHIPRDSAELRLVRQCPTDLIRMVRDGTGHDNRLVHKREETSVVESRSNIKQKAYGTSAVNPRHRRRMVKTEAVSSPILDDVAVVDNQFDQEEEASIEEIKPSTSSKRPTKRARMEKKRGRPRAFASNTVFNDDNLELVNVDDLCDQVMAVHTPRVGKKGRKRLTLVESPVPVEESTTAAPMEDGEHGAADKEEETTAGPKKRKAKPRRPQAPKKKKETDLALNVAVSVVKQAQLIEVAPGPSSSKSPKKRTSRVSSATGNITGIEPTTRNMPIETTQPGRRKAAIAADAINTSILNTSSTASDEIVADRLMQKWKKRLGK